MKWLHSQFLLVQYARLKVLTEYMMPRPVESVGNSQSTQIMTPMYESEAPVYIHCSLMAFQMAFKLKRLDKRRNAHLRITFTGPRVRIHSCRSRCRKSSHTRLRRRLQTHAPQRRHGLQPLEGGGSLIRSRFCSVACARDRIVRASAQAQLPPSLHLHPYARSFPSLHMRAYMHA